jgi:hypothetical protein
MKDDPSLPPGMHPAFWRALCQEHEQEVEHDLMGRLVQGSRKSGVKLAANECAILLHMLRPKPKPKRRRPPLEWDTISAHADDIIYRSMWFGASVTEAVKATAEKFHVSEPTVWKHWKAWNENRTETWKANYK